MLWLKGWQETRTRFWLCAVALGGYCASLVSYYNLFCRKRDILGAARLSFYPQYVRTTIFGDSAAQLFFLVLMLLLGTGGLLREKTLRTAGCTLALPVPRWRLFVSQLGIGLLQAAVLALIPGLVVAALSPVVGFSYPLERAATFAVPWAVCGGAVFAVAFLCSALFEADYVAPVVSIIAIAGFSYVSDIEVLKSLNLDLQTVMNGADRIAALPWGKLSGLAATALLMFGVAACCLYRRDF